ncbi:cyclopropane-fatty-acyl-phospholipid synthase family protein [Yoonia sp.]|uniref:SAM-dependent methyltransferase n=1 Tax=Yoonia sp. TaxID=2212373 RepID=UPI00358FFA67
MTAAALDYIPGLISAYRAGHAGDHVHLGYWGQGAASDWRTAQEAMTDLHLDALDLQDGQTVIDVGCGIGGSLRLANARLLNSRLVGVNIDPRQLAICETHEATGANRLEWLECDAGAVPIGDCSVDRILSLEAMFHFPARQDFLSEAARMLRPAGVLVCSDIVFGTPRKTTEARLLAVVQQGYAPWPQPVLKVDATIQMGRIAGLALRRIADLTAHVMPTWDHIVSSRDDPERSPVAAMRDLHRAGLLHYPMYVFEKRGA